MACEPSSPLAGVWGDGERFKSLKDSFLSWEMCGLVWSTAQARWEPAVRLHSPSASAPSNCNGYPAVRGIEEGATGSLVEYGKALSMAAVGGIGDVRGAEAGSSVLDEGSGSVGR